MSMYSKRANLRLIEVWQPPRTKKDGFLRSRNPSGATALANESYVLPGSAIAKGRTAGKHGWRWVGVAAGFLVVSLVVVSLTRSPSGRSSGAIEQRPAGALANSNEKVRVVSEPSKPEPTSMVIPLTVEKTLAEQSDISDIDGEVSDSNSLDDSRSEVELAFLSVQALASGEVIHERTPVPSLEEPEPLGFEDQIALGFEDRIGLSWADDLRRELESVPELDLYSADRELLYLVADPATPDPGIRDRLHPQSGQEDGLADSELDDPLASALPEFEGLPWQEGSDCRGEPESISLMANISSNFRLLRGVLGRTSSSETPNSEERIARYLLGEKSWHCEQAIPALVQTLQPEGNFLRSKLVEVLSSIEGPKASIALAQRALFDLESQVRQMAIEALTDRPREEYRQILLDGFRHPWPPVADHAATALVALDDREAVEKLTDLLDEPAPTALSRDRTNEWVVKELVRVNHLRNCLLCHAPSNSPSDRLRGFVPVPGEKIPVQYYHHSSGTFVRADISYLKQDFSVSHYVPNHEPWPSQQRYDYLVRTRAATPEEIRSNLSANAEQKTYPQRQAVLFAIGKLTQKDE